MIILIIIKRVNYVFKANPVRYPHPKEIKRNTKRTLISFN